MKVLSKLRESTSANMKLKVDNELLIIMMCHCRFILSKKKKKKTVQGSNIPNSDNQRLNTF